MAGARKGALLGQRQELALGGMHYLLEKGWRLTWRSGGVCECVGAVPVQSPRPVAVR